MSEGFFRSRDYWSRACERDARQFVDERMEEICAYFGVPFQRPQHAGVVTPMADPLVEVRGVAALFRGCTRVTVGDVREELRLSRMLNPRNVRLVLEELKRTGTEVSEASPE